MSKIEDIIRILHFEWQMFQKMNTKWFEKSQYRNGWYIYT